LLLIENLVMSKVTLLNFYPRKTLRTRDIYYETINLLKLITITDSYAQKLLHVLICVISYHHLTVVAILSIRCNQVRVYYANEVKICKCGYPVQRNGTKLKVDRF
jgi:hypothetical protein